MVEIYLIRHAESELNKIATLIGGRSNEIPLSELGIKQAKVLGNRLRYENTKFDMIYSSTAIRTMETARHSIEALGYSIDNVIKSDDLLELDQGDWEKQPRDKIYTEEVLEQINDDNWNFKAPNGESQKDVEHRMTNWINNNIINNYNSDSKIAIYTHGLAIKCFLRGVFDFSPQMTYKTTIDNTSITRLKHDDKGWSPLTINDASHIYQKHLNL